jgi:hypothetical protein
LISVQLDNVRYFCIEFQDVPIACVEVDVLVDDNGVEIKSATPSGRT